MRVYDVLRQRIATRQYAPGSRLTEAEIADEFEVSRTPVRQALHRLAVEGLVEVKNGVGIRVTEVDDAELQDIYEWRMSLPTLIGRLCRAALQGGSGRAQRRETAAVESSGKTSSRSTNMPICATNSSRGSTTSSAIRSSPVPGPALHRDRPLLVRMAGQGGTAAGSPVLLVRSRGIAARPRGQRLRRARHDPAQPHLHDAHPRRRLSQAAVSARRTFAANPPELLPSSRP